MKLLIKFLLWIKKNCLFWISLSLIAVLIFYPYNSFDPTVGGIIENILTNKIVEIDSYTVSDKVEPEIVLKRKSLNHFGGFTFLVGVTVAAGIMTIIITRLIANG